ncbi:acetolactate synthase large subunit [Amycolatopsis cihanbeyliensis]|nr:acetolactate synthase large subunit [Amycolatopsis cihanbeyliensis]
MNETTGARAVLDTLRHRGVEACFTNPGTSEMHFVSELGVQLDMRAVLCLFEGGATGAADGYGRMVDRPACTLLHLGPGLGNGVANLHNARRAGTPILNIVGDHATHHKVFDAPLESDIDALASTVSRWVRRTTSVGEAGRDAADAVAATGSVRNGTGSVATLILPADMGWGVGGRAAAVSPVSMPEPDRGRVEEVALLLRRHAPHVTVLLGGDLLKRRGREAASRLATATGARILAESSPARQERGAGIPEVERLVEVTAAEQLAGTRVLVLAGARAPVSFFASPRQPSSLVPLGTAVVELGATVAALQEVADVLAPGVNPVLVGLTRPGMPSGELTARKAAAVVGALLPEGAIVSDEAVTSGWWLAQETAHCPPHDWLTLTGGAIGQGMPVALGAAVACPDRPVLNLQADGSAMYTLQALWTQAREGLNVTTVIFNNSSYAILKMELERRGPSVNERSKKLLELPGLDFVSLARGMGVPAEKVATAEDLAQQLRRSLAEPGPSLIEAIVPAVASFRNRPTASSLDEIATDVGDEGLGTGPGV